MAVRRPIPMVYRHVRYSVRHALGHTATTGGSTRRSTRPMARACRRFASHDTTPHRGPGTQLELQAVTTRCAALLRTVALCVDGPDVVTSASRPLVQQLAQFYALTADATRAVERVLDTHLKEYAAVVGEKYVAHTRAGGGAHTTPRGWQDPGAFESWLHDVRRVQKLFAKAAYLRQGTRALSQEQRDFLAAAVPRVEEYMRAAADACASEGGASGCARDAAGGARASGHEPQVPRFVPLYDTTAIDAVVTALADAMGLPVAARPELFMTMVRQMVLFAPVAPEGTASEAACGGAGGGPLTTFDLDRTLRFGAGCLIVQRVFDSGFVARAAAHVAELGRRQQKGVVHFVANPDHIPSRRLWDCLQNDSDEGLFLAQVKHPVVAAINATTLGTQWRVGSLAINETVPGSVAQEPHIDYTKWRKYGPFFTEFARGEGGLESESLQGTVALEPFTAEVGATGIIPGSQHWESYPVTAAQVEEYMANEVVACMDAGDYLVFNPNCQHRGRANSTPDQTRKAGVYQFVMGGLQPMEVPGRRVEACIDRATTYDEHYLRLIHTYPYPDDLAGKAGKEINAEGGASVLRDDHT